jgi:uncharacterized protein (DUF1919 family)
MLTIPTLITYNCAAAHFYQMMSAQYQTPTVGNLFRDWRHFLLFAGDLERYTRAEPTFVTGTLPRHNNNARYPVSSWGDVEIHWIHAKDQQTVLHRLAVGRARMEWDNIVVTFAESNFGPNELDEEQQELFHQLWKKIPYRKFFFAAGHYKHTTDQVDVRKWLGKKHFEGICGRGLCLCKPTCFGCGRVGWGHFIEEARLSATVLGLREAAAFQLPFTPE